MPSEIERRASYRATAIVGGKEVTRTFTKKAGARAWLEEEFLREHPVFGRFPIDPAEIRVPVRVVVEEIRQARLPAQAVPDRHRLLVRGDAGDVLGDRVIELELAALGQQEDPCHGVIDGARPRAEDRLEVVRDAAVMVRHSEPALEHELGDLLFALATYGRKQGIDPEAALRSSLNRFSSRFKHCEQQANAEGKGLRDYEEPELDAMWERAKAAERGE